MVGPDPERHGPETRTVPGPGLHAPVQEQVRRPEGRRSRSRPSGEAERNADLSSPPVVLSFGGGKNSTAVLSRYLREGRRLDAVVFADTGEESRETLAVVRHAQMICEAAGVVFAVVRGHGEQRLVDWYQEQRSIPFITRRSCTDHFKIRPVRRWMTANGYRPVTVLVGIAWDEVHRVRDSDVKWATNEYPLCEWKWNRDACDAEIATHWTGPPVPKSGCEGCPMMGRKGYHRLRQQRPAVFARWRALEENGRHYGDASRHHTLLAQGPSMASIEAQTSLDVVDDDERDAACGGGCFT